MGMPVENRKQASSAKQADDAKSDDVGTPGSQYARLLIESPLAYLLSTRAGAGAKSLLLLMSTCGIFFVCMLFENLSRCAHC